MHIFKNSNAAVRQRAFTKDSLRRNLWSWERKQPLLFNESHVVGKMQLALYIIAKEYNLLVMITINILYGTFETVLYVNIYCM